MTAGLFNKPNEGTVVVHDIDGNTKEIAIKELKFRISVYGILPNGNKVLAQWNPTINRHFLPGGGVDLGEKLEGALIREFQEETGFTVKIIKLLDVKEDFFAFGKEYAHSVLIFYQVEKVSGELLEESNGDDSDRAEFVTVKELEKEGLQSQYIEILNMVI